MKILLLVLLSVVIIFKTPGNPLPICNIATVKQALPPVIFFETTIDGPKQPIFVTRFLHNKIGIYSSEATKCYFNAFDFIFIDNSISIVGLVGILVFAYKSIIKKYYWLLVLLLFLPFLPFFTNSDRLLILAYKIFAIIGLYFAFFRK